MKSDLAAMAVLDGSFYHPELVDVSPGWLK